MNNKPFWHFSLEDLLKNLKSQQEGLTHLESKRRLKQYGKNSLAPPKRYKRFFLFLSQFKSPLILLLIGAAILSYFLGGRTDSLIILTIVLFSGILGFFQEKGALSALEKILQIAEIKVSTLRDGTEQNISTKALVPGDIILLRAGDLVPADCVLIETNHFFVDESTLTGESSPVEKIPSSMKKNSAIFLGTMVISGIGKALVTQTGKNTEYGHILQHIRFRPPETAFELGIRKIGYFLLEVTMILVLAILFFNLLLQKPLIESLLFSLAIAVGLAPQLLPAIISVNLAHGARLMAKKHVIIKRLPSIENFGQMNILCTDKTGTITSGHVELTTTAGIDLKHNPKVALYGFLNAHFQAGYPNPLDQAILKKETFPTAGWKKTGEIPYDFSRKCLSILLSHQEKPLIVTKGAVLQILSICSHVELPNGTIEPISQHKNELEQAFARSSEAGFQTLALAYGKDFQEKNLIFLGFLQFFDPIKPDIAKTIASLKERGIQIKIITGDHPSVATHLSPFLGIDPSSVITGEKIHKSNDHALLKIAKEKDVFAQIDPIQKERIILALRRTGNVVGFLGDGINDVSALHCADVGIAVNSGAPAAKEAADIILLKKDLSVLIEGVEEGRRAFTNTLKYIYMAISANFGNMFSMAGASLFLKFLPLLPKQVLLTNFFSDLPEMALAVDRVDPETRCSPVKWDLSKIRRFMIVFGLISSLADYLTFAFLIFWAKPTESLFRSFWFIESVLSATLIVLAIRTARPFWKSKPGKLLTVSVFTIFFGTPLLPYTPIGSLFDLVPIPLSFYGVLIGILGFYVLSVEIAKRFFFKRF